MEWLIVVWLPLLLALMAIGWVLTLLGMPGNWLMVGATLGYVLLVPNNSQVALSLTVVVVTAVLAGLGELIELVAGAAGAAKQGGSRRGAILALVGSLIGAVVGMLVGLPIPVVGSVLAALLFAGVGALAGAIVGEQWKGRTLDHSWKVGQAAFIGRILGTLGKMLLGSVIVAVVLAALLLSLLA